MPGLPAEFSDSEIVAFVDRWVALLEQEDYEAARTFASDDPGRTGWSAASIREAIQRHGERATVEGVSDAARPSVKEVTRWPTKDDGSCGDVWYDLYIDGRGSDLTALFHLTSDDGGLTIELIDIGVR